MNATLSLPSDEAIMRQLIGQVQRAAQGASEQTVKTIVTRPLWRAWCRAVKMPEDSKPTRWLGIKKTNRIFGSHTVVVESEELFSISYKPA